MSTLCSVCNVTPCKQLPSTPLAAAAAASGSDPSANQLPLRPKAGPGFSPSPLPRTASRPVNHSSRPHCSAWPAGTLAMATQIPADLAVKNRSSQKYERQESLIQGARMGFTPESKMSRSHDWRLLKWYFSFFFFLNFCEDMSLFLHRKTVCIMKWSISLWNCRKKSMYN